MPEFYMIFPPKINKMPEFYVFARKFFSGFLWGWGQVPPAPVFYTYGLGLGLALGGQMGVGLSVYPYANPGYQALVVG